MREITSSHSRYLPIVQQRWCCVPACLSMIMYRRGIPLMPQEHLAYHLGLIVPKEDVHLFSKSRTGIKPSAGYGTQIEKKQFSPNTVFPKLGIPLVMTYHPAKELDEEDLINLLVEGEQKDKDFLICFDTGALGNSKKHGGHVCVFDSINTKKKTIVLIDPSSSQPKWRTVSIADLHRGMCYHWNKSGGIWEFRQKSKRLVTRKN